jgi:predicted  nucleic acid-binding Zn-ribbon protein
MRSHPGQSRLTVAAIILPVLALAACESPPPTAAMERARTAIEGAQLDGADQLASSQLQQAQAKLSSAQSAVGAKDMTQAKYLAEESEMEAINADQAALAQNAVNTQNQIAQLQASQGSGSSQQPAPRSRASSVPQNQ